MKHHLSCLKGDTIKAIILVCLAVGVVGMSYGSLAIAYGFPVWVPFVLSITVLAGASEFMFIGIVASGGNPLAATVANGVLAQMDGELLAGVKVRHDLIVEKLNALNTRYDLFSAVRGMGLLIGAELASHLRGQAKTLTTLAAEEGLIALIAGPDVLRFAPALNIPLADIEEAFVRLERAVARLTA